MSQLLELRELHLLRRQFLHFDVSIVFLEGLSELLLVLSQALVQFFTKFFKRLAPRLSVLLEN